MKLWQQAWKNWRQVKRTVDLSDIYALLRSTGISAGSADFFYTAYALYLASKQPQRLLFASSWLYPEVAKHYHTTVNNVERGIWRTAHVLWKDERCVPKQTARCNLPEQLTPSRFLAVLVHALMSDAAA